MWLQTGTKFTKSWCTETLTSVYLSDYLTDGSHNHIDESKSIEELKKLTITYLTEFNKITNSDDPLLNHNYFALSNFTQGLIKTAESIVALQTS